MDQPLFSCTRCLKSFPSSQMSRSGTICKTCNTHHSSFKQCDYCRSDFKRTISGTICPRCQSLKSRHGEPKPCSICHLTMAFGGVLVCQRCSHYRAKFGDPRQCEKCLQLCAFYKDEASRNKVDGQVLCWVCTYNYKVSKSKERSGKHQSKRGNPDDPYTSKSHDSSGSIKRQRTEDFAGRHSSNRSGNALNDSLDSAYNEHLVTISQLQEEMRGLKRSLVQKDAELLAKDRVIAGLRADLDDFETQRRERAYKSQVLANEEIEKLKDTIRTLKREKADLLAARNTVSKRRRAVNVDTLSPLTLSPIRLPQHLSGSASKEKHKNLHPPKRTDTSTKFQKPPEEAPPADTESKEAPSPSYSTYLEDSLSPLPEKIEVKEKRDNGNGTGNTDKPEQLLVSSSDDEEEGGTNGPKK
ncbi:hypothetical protein Aperf_G00000113127 [Anoplocephala perfoliata]